MSKKFGTGVATGILTTLGALAVGLFTYKKKVLDPEDKEDSRIADNRRKANRKSFSAHQS
ncbi:DUF3042 family protein [Lactobacillus iners]|jgi:hypothetical protein|uniref:DUF3042 domain-containing protein n=3 Tax=Lactobacillus iners TaxID=147802 RepID=C8PAE7_9LACO|nr:DUF3042 family protein [Lactobacillus iners]EFO67058.1 hypothetical protein HMPREF9214_0447 [Lactobacillus iners LactinV 11V1-d]EFO67671.1 hypothetical protein HMPREF9213_1352 [Lactobacillus iners LactinV 09V1-c]EFO69626.1 hypothetical protein HMPREF9212_0739 [Lactobacillus iners LactinV 03V1-b]EFO70549.1 hypothetical protein HMPREF9211_0520 [Lactobacillus iners LactinV 01V1-a]EEW52436.1 hypothetical protein HMPREF0520_0067 [Lactobacillus iners DSM 13335]